MAIEHPKRVPFTPTTELGKLLEDIRADKLPRAIEKDGEVLAILVSPEEYPSMSQAPKSKVNKEKILALAGAWKDLDAEELIDYIYRGRHEAPISPPVDL